MDKKIKENNMKTALRLEAMMMKEEDFSIERPLQSTGSTPEVKDIAPEKKEDANPPSEADKKFKLELQKIMKKVKENQTVEWKELIDLLGTFEKTDFNKE